MSTGIGVSLYREPVIIERVLLPWTRLSGVLPVLMRTAVRTTRNVGHDACVLENAL
jgi:hypothetical protein